MGNGSRGSTWWRYATVAVAYGLGASLFRWVLIPHWLIVAGLNLSALILVPYRYWPSLFVGESLALLETSVACEGQFGLTWAALNLIPSLVFIAPFAHVARERWHVFQDNVLNMGALLACALLVSAAVTLNSALMLAITPLPHGYILHWDEVLGRWMLGNYMGILTITPTVLLFRQAMAQRRWQAWMIELLDSKLTWETGGLVVPVLGLLVWIGLSASPHANTRQIAQIAMFLPVVWMALRHGWQGASLAGTAASFAIIALMPEKHDHNTMQAEVLCAFVISTMLLVGGRITLMNRRADQERADVRAALALAQRNAYVGELHLRLTATALEQIQAGVQAGFSMMMGRLRHLQPAVDDSGYRRHVLGVQAQIEGLSEGLYPSAWRESGLPAALERSAVAQALREGGITYRCDLRGSVSALPQSLRVAIYRSVNEAIVDLCANQDVSDILVQLRTRLRGGRCSAVVTVSGGMHPVRIKHVDWAFVRSRLARTTSGLGWRGGAIQDRAATFEGRARDRVTSRGRRISMSFLAPQEPGDL